jgi:hypothetical protein
MEGCQAAKAASTRLRSSNWLYWEVLKTVAAGAPGAYPARGRCFRCWSRSGRASLSRIDGVVCLEAAQRLCGVWGSAGTAVS